MTQNEKLNTNKTEIKQLNKWVLDNREDLQNAQIELEECKSQLSKLEQTIRTKSEESIKARNRISKLIIENEGLEKMFEVRECHDDISFLMTFLDQDDMEKLELFSFKRAGDNIVVDDVSDKDGWKKVKTSLLMNTGVNLIPTIYVQRVAKDGSLILSHVYDNRELDLDSADKVKDDLSKLWDGQVKLFTIIEGEQWEI